MKTITVTFWSIVNRKLLRVWEETGGTSSSDKPYDSSVNPGGNATTSGGPGPRVKGSVGGESRVSGSVDGKVKTCSQTESAMA